MPLTRAWYTITEAASKYGVSIEQLSKWVDLGLIRTDEHKGEATLLNCHDIEQELHLIPSL